VVALRDLLARIAETYDQRLGFDSEAQHLLRASPEEVAPLIPAGYHVTHGGAEGVEPRSRGSASLTRTRPTRRSAACTSSISLSLRT
jgi:hypothetical protein